MTVICDRTTKYYTKGVKYKAKRIFPKWSWMIMAWDNGSIGRYIHDKDFGAYRIRN